MLHDKFFFCAYNFPILKLTNSPPKSVRRGTKAILCISGDNVFAFADIAQKCKQTKKIYFSCIINTLFIPKNMFHMIKILPCKPISILVRIAAYARCIISPKHVLIAIKIPLWVVGGSAYLFFFKE